MSAATAPARPSKPCSTRPPTPASRPRREILDKVRERLAPPERYLADQRSLGRGWQELAAELGRTDVALRKQLTRALNKVLVGLGVEDDGDG